VASSTAVLWLATPCELVRGERAPRCPARHRTYTVLTVQPSWSHAWKVSPVLAVGLCAPFLASPARACSQLERVIESSYPAPGATNVPTNVVLYAAGDQVGAEGLFLETAGGVRVPITVTDVLPTGFDITPAIELEPNQSYVLHHPGFSLLAAGPVSTSVEFETGSGPAAPAVLPSPELVGAVILDGVDSPCPNERLCLEPDSSDSALFAANSFNNASEREPGTLTGAYGNTFVPEGCLQIWRRDALGNRSDAVELCAAETTRVELSGDATSTTCNEYRQQLLDIDEPDDPGCTLTLPGAPASSGGAWGAMFGVIAVLGLSRRRLCGFGTERSSRPGRSLSSQTREQDGRACDRLR
jgi:hypothetical protein